MSTDKGKIILEQIDIQKLNEIVKKNKNASHYIGLFSAILGIIGIIFAITNVFYMNKIQNIEIDSQTNNIAMTDISINNNDILINPMSKKDNVIEFITKFLTVKSNKTLEKFYADTVQNYYLRKNLRLGQIIQEKKWFIQEHPKSKVVFKKSDITVILKDDTTSEVFINTLYYPDSSANPTEIIYQIKLNKDNKVYFVRNLKPQQRNN